MMSRKRSRSAYRLLMILVLVFPLTPVLAGCALRASGEELVQQECTRCHTLAPIEVASKTGNQWEHTVHKMIEHGADLST